MSREALRETAMICWICWHIWNAVPSSVTTLPALRDRASYKIVISLYATNYVLPFRYHVLQFLIDVTESVYLGVTVPPGKYVWTLFAF